MLESGLLACGCLQGLNGCPMLQDALRDVVARGRQVQRQRVSHSRDKAKRVCLGLVADASVVAPDPAVRLRMVWRVQAVLGTQCGAGYTECTSDLRPSPVATGPLLREQAHMEKLFSDPPAHWEGPVCI